MMVSEDNLDDAEYVADLIEILKKEQVYVSSACIPLLDYLRQKQPELYKKYKHLISDIK